MDIYIFICQFLQTKLNCIPTTNYLSIDMLTDRIHEIKTDAIFYMNNRSNNECCSKNGINFNPILLLSYFVKTECEIINDI